MLKNTIDELSKKMPSTIEDGYYELIETNDNDEIRSRIPGYVEDYWVYTYYPLTGMWHFNEWPSRYTVMPDEDEYIFVPISQERLVELVGSARKIPRRGSGAGLAKTLESQTPEKRRFNAEVGLIHTAGNVFSREVVKVLEALNVGDRRLVARYPEDKKSNASTLASEVNKGEKAALKNLNLIADSYRDEDGTWVVAVTKQ